MIKLTPPQRGFFHKNLIDFIFALRTSGAFVKDSFVLLKGTSLQAIYDDDNEYMPVPENLLYYLSGVTDEDTYALIDLTQQTIVLYVILPDPSKTYWMKLRSLDDYVRDYEITTAKPFESLIPDLHPLVGKNKLYLNVGVSPYSGIESTNPKAEIGSLLPLLDVDTTTLYEYACEQRVHKSAEEVRLIKQAVDVATDAHKAVWKFLRPGITEKVVSNYFSSQCVISSNARRGYSNIVGCACDASVLHMEPEDRILKDGDLVLLDAGARVFGYNSDLTRTVPVSGKFTEKQREIYNLVLEAQDTVFRMVRPGVRWQDCHVAAERVILAGLIQLKLLKGDLDDLWGKRAIYYFFPHGVGHYLGLYVHDLPGLKKYENDWVPYNKMNLRVKRKLDANMVLTNEPGVYFNKALLDLARADPAVKDAIDFDKVEEYRREVGGVRIEDVFVVTDTGCKNLSDNLPKTVFAIETTMKELRSGKK